jgi:DMSO reductase anchor subunit
MVQLLIYPSFIYFSSAALHTWHERYTFNMALIVIPLMFGQLVVYGIEVYHTQTAFTVCGLMIVIALWVFTLSCFVPLHKAINDNTSSRNTLKRLVAANWIRTVLWTGLFMWSVCELIQVPKS